MYMAWKYDGSSVDPHLPCSNCQGTHQRFHPPVETGQVSASEHGEAPKSPKKSSSRGWPWLTVAMLVGHPTYVWGAKMLRVNNEIAMCTPVCNDSSFLPYVSLTYNHGFKQPCKIGHLTKFEAYNGVNATKLLDSYNVEIFIPSLPSSSSSS